MMLDLATFGKLLAEFLGTVVFVFMVCGSVVIPAAYSDGDSEGILVTAFIQGLSLMAVVFTFADISGSHFNPAITVTFLLLGSINMLLAAAYIACQISGSIVGAFLFRACVNRYMVGKAGATTIASGVSVGQAFTLETIMTCILLFVVVSTSFNLKNGLPSVRPLPIGFSLVAAVLVAGPLTGASLNPVRSLGPAIVAGEWANHWVYWTAPFLASFVVAALYRFIFQAATSPVEPQIV